MKAVYSAGDSDKKCEVCNKIATRAVNSKFYCLEHYVSKYYGKNIPCLKTRLDILIDSLDSGEGLSEYERRFLQAVEKCIPEMAKEFPRIFEKELD